MALMVIYVIEGQILDSHLPRSMRSSHAIGKIKKTVHAQGSRRQQSTW
jgi:hypothetical protein